MNLSLVQQIQQGVSQFFKQQHDADIDTSRINVNTVAKDIAGDYSVVLFPFLKQFSTNPNELGQSMGDYLVENLSIVSNFEIVRGFLNLTLGDSAWQQRWSTFLAGDVQVGIGQPTNKTLVVEFCSPNTNKPIHLGHIRNILIGWSMSQILEYAGNDVKKVQIINDRGIAICKSMLAWQKYADGETPGSSGIKGDHFVGKYYVLFDQKFKAEYDAWQETDVAKAVYTDQQKENEKVEYFFKRYKNTYFNEYSALGKEAREMLMAWEAGDDTTVNLWKQMNGWVYEGFDETHAKLGTTFDKLYYESDTYIRGKQAVQEGLAQGKFYQKDDGSIWADLEEYGLDHKILLRSDGTSVYITQDIGTAQERYDDYTFDAMAYVVADEQDYHFQALFATLKKLDSPFAGKLHHLSYGMVDLPTGKMKSREGTVVDADDLIADVISEAAEVASESHALESVSDEEKKDIFDAIGLGALKYFILKVQPKRRMTFDPSQSVEMQGQTGPYIQNAYVRIASVLEKSGMTTFECKDYEWQPQEKKLLVMLDNFGKIVQESANQMDPSIVANYAFELAKDYHKFYHDHRILSAETEEAKQARLGLSSIVADVLKTAMRLLGITMPSKM